MDQSSKSMRVDDAQRPFCYKFLAPMPLCASLMGPKGKIIQEIQNETNTFIKFTDRGNCYPNSNSRTGTVQGCSVEMLGNTVKTVIGHLVECSQTTHPVDLSEVISNGGLMFSMIIPKPMRGVIIGSGGAQVTELRKMSNTKIKLEDGMPSDSVVKIEGPAEGICAVALWITDKLGEAVEDSYFSPWVKGHQIPYVHDDTRQRPHLIPTMRNGGNPAVGALQDRRRDDNCPPHERLARTPYNISEIVNKVSRDIKGDSQTHSMQVPIPIHFKGALIGKGGCGVKEIMHESQCSILNVSGEDETHCMVNIEGSIMACTAAYLLVMRRYVAHSRAPRRWEQPHGAERPKVEAEEFEAPAVS